MALWLLCHAVSVLLLFWRLRPQPQLPPHRTGRAPGLAVQRRRCPVCRLGHGDQRSPGAAAGLCAAGRQDAAGQAGDQPRLPGRGSLVTPGQQLDLRPVRGPVELQVLGLAHPQGGQRDPPGGIRRAPAAQRRLPRRRPRRPRLLLGLPARHSVLGEHGAHRRQGPRLQGGRRHQRLAVDRQGRFRLRLVRGGAAQRPSPAQPDLRPPPGQRPGLLHPAGRGAGQVPLQHGGRTIAPQHR